MVRGLLVAALAISHKKTVDVEDEGSNTKTCTDVGQDDECSNKKTDMEGSNKRTYTDVGQNDEAPWPAGGSRRP